MAGLATWYIILQTYIKTCRYKPETCHSQVMARSWRDHPRTVLCIPHYKGIFVYKRCPIRAVRVAHLPNHAVRGAHCAHRAVRVAHCARRALRGADGPTVRRTAPTMRCVGRAAPTKRCGSRTYLTRRQNDLYGGPSIMKCGVQSQHIQPRRPGAKR
jgi:hypothetical protein